MGGLTSAAVWRGSPGRCCVTGAPELQLRRPDLSTRCSIRDTGLAAMKSGGRAKLHWVAGFGSALDLGSVPWGLAVGAGRGRGSRSQSSEGAVPWGILEVVVHFFSFPSQYAF